MMVLLRSGAGMVGRALIVMVGALIFYSCTTTEPNPTKEKPLWGCHITCPDGFTPFRHQHICRGGRRWFEDVRIFGQTKELWLTNRGDYEKVDIELGSCDSYIRTLIDNRDRSKRGVYPGEDELGRPKPQ